jgi:hypothetical protein
VAGSRPVSLDEARAAIVVARTYGAMVDAFIDLELRALHDR